MEYFVFEVCICEDLNENVLCVMVVINFVKVVIENFEGEEWLKVLNYLNCEELGFCELFFMKEFYIDEVDFCEEVNK